MEFTPSTENGTPTGALPVVVCGGTPARVRRLWIRTASTLAFVAVMLPLAGHVVLVNPMAYFRDRPPRDCYAQFALLEHRINWLDATPNYRPRPARPDDVMATEWPLFSLSFLSAAAFEMGKQDARFTRAAGDLIAKCLDEALRRRTYGSTGRSWGDPLQESTALSGNVVYLGHLNLMLVRYAQLTRDAHYDTLCHRLSIALHRDFERSPTLCLESSPGVCWTSDQAVALASLVAHDDLYGTHFGDVAHAWVARVRGNLDSKTHLLPARLDADTGEQLQPPRGSTLALAISFLCDLDPAFAREQYEGFVKYFYVHRGGLGAFRESLRGRLGPIGLRDRYGAPVLFGLGVSASGFGLAAAKAVGDRQVFGELLQAGEILGLPVSFLKRKDYLLTPRVGDSVALWAKALPATLSVRPAYRRGFGWLLWYLPVFSLAFLLGVTAHLGALRRARVGLSVCQSLRDNQLGRAAAQARDLRVGVLSQIHLRGREELQMFVTRAVMLPSPLRQEWVRKSDLIGYIFGTFSGAGLLFAFGVLSAFHVHKVWYLIALLLAYVVLGRLERAVDNRLWQRLLSTVR